MTATASRPVIRAGVLSDTHLSGRDEYFNQQVQRCFASCEVIIHAGDVTDLAILQAFAGKQLFCVHGNMCSPHTRAQLPARRIFRLGAFTIGLTHGADLGADIEARLWEIFPEADCMIYGHTHRASQHRQHGVLFLNPGSFRETSRFGAPGSYAILEAGEELRCSLHNLLPLP